MHSGPHKVKNVTFYSPCGDIFDFVGSRMHSPWGIYKKKKMRLELVSYFLHKQVHAHMHIHIQAGHLFLDPLLILYVFPLINKWSVYNFNGRFIFQKIQKNVFQKSYKLICILMSQISIWSSINQQDFWLPGVFLSLKGGAPNLSLFPV